MTKNPRKPTITARAADESLGRRLTEALSDDELRLVLVRALLALDEAPIARSAALFVHHRPRQGSALRAGRVDASTSTPRAPPWRSPRRGSASS